MADVQKCLDNSYFLLNPFFGVRVFWGAAIYLQ